MAEATTPSTPVTFDDRIDTKTEISVSEVFSILKRSLSYIWPAKSLFLLKFLLMIGSFVPAFVAIWPLKILTDQVILGKAFDESAVRFPPYIQPFVDAVGGLDPTGLLLATLAFLAVLVVLFGAGVGGGDGQIAFLAQGEDTASQSENMISAGWSMTGGIWGFGDLLCNIRLVQRVTNYHRTALFQRLIRLPMTTLDDQAHWGQHLSNDVRRARHPRCVLRHYFDACDRVAWRVHIPCINGLQLRRLGS